MINSGDAVILRDAGNFKRSIPNVKSSDNYKIGKTTIPGSAIIGRNFGETIGWQPSTQTWARCQSTLIEAASTGLEEEAPVDEQQEDMTKNLDATQEDADDTLQTRAASAAFNSVTFMNKSKFSQEKYLIKKHKKYSKEITLLHPSLLLISESIEDDIKPETVGLIIRYANVTCGSNVLAFDDGSGLLIAALIERGCNVTRVTAGKGTASNKASLEIGLKNSSLKEISLLYLTNMSKATVSHIDNQTSKRTRLNEEEEERVTSTESPEVEVASPKAANRPIMSPIMFDSIVIGSTSHSEANIDQIIESTLPLLTDSCGHLSVYFKYFEQASKWQKRLRIKQQFINITMTELFFREHQIMPNRTHPLMQSQSQLFNGFVLSCIKVQP